MWKSNWQRSTPNFGVIRGGLPAPAPLSFGDWIFIAAREGDHFDVGEHAVFDVDNAKKKKVFVPHQVPSTELTREALKQLRRKLFPELMMEEFLTQKSAFNLDPTPLDQCPLNHLMD